MILTDSGGVQKEAFFFKKPCLIIRSESEWVEIINFGLGIITDADEQRIVDAFNHFKKVKLSDFEPIFGDGMAATFICKEIIKHSKKNDL
jgi:UDP-GlcNAc3NAcA epimerase